MSKSRKVDTSHLTEHIGFWMRLVSNSVSYTFAQKLETSGVTVAEWVVLREMYGRDETTSPSEVADLTGLTRGAVSKLITRLLDKGLVNRQESSEDRRYQDIKLTAKAVSLIPKLAVLADKNDDAFFSCLNKSDRHQLKSLLQKIADHHELKTMPTT